MDFVSAYEAARDYEKPFRRLSWGNEQEFIVVMPEMELPPYKTQGTSRKVNDRTAKFIGEDSPLRCVEYFAKYDGYFWTPGWSPTPLDIVSVDWVMVELKNG